MLRMRTAMRPRDPEEAHRLATPLELFFDLTFVVAVAQAAAGLHHGLVGEHAGDALLAYPMVFFAIWWAWMNFTWFASAYDTDDALYRLTVLVQMGGVLVLAAGVPRAMEQQDWGVVTLGYLIMRLGLVTQWLRAARSDRGRRASALRYAAGVSALQAGWLLLLVASDDVRLAGFLVLVAGELAVPVWAERAASTPWHPHHIAERYGLFTIIVLGESVLAATLAVQGALDAGDELAELATITVGGLLMVGSMWWLYFDQPAQHLTARAREAMTASSGRGAFLWGYGHYVVFASAAATGAGIAVAVDQATGKSALSDAQVGLIVAVPAALYLLALWLLHAPAKLPGPMRTLAAPVGIVVIVAASQLGEAVLTTGLALAGLVAAGLLDGHRRAATEV